MRSSGDVSPSSRYDVANLCVLTLQTLVWAVTLTWLSCTEAGWYKWLVLIPFCLVMQGVFSMMHEAFHELAHSEKKLNYLVMWWASTLFGASATLIHVNHLGHHTRNRTRAELADFAVADESLLRKRIEYYFAILGGIWLAAFVGSLLLPLLPARITDRWSQTAEVNTYAAAFKDFSKRDFKRIRLEVIASVAVWLSAGLLLGWTWHVVLVAYIVFAFSWSSLQWVYHMRTPLDVVEGAYNMRAPRLVRWAFLNFNYNLTHHRQSGLHWQQMHRASNLRETRPLWFGWLQVFLPPQRLPSDLTQLDKTYF
ncbi:fatty acid desaturase family protein [Pseudomonas sp. NPDC087342]|uniref:fatty acid desaturase family protein n=1 Tax=Pseudomonas sp. NPDC087342 TaxID=3364437 RepID=UPI0037FC0B25